MKLPKPSEEQANILVSFLSGYNIIVDSVAGSGKTTTVLHCSTRTKKSILMLTYNRRLKEECRSKAANIPNLEVHSYHSLAYRYYKPGYYHDSDISDILTEDIRPLYPICFDIIVLDEQQDMKPLYASLIKKLLKDSGRKVQIMVIGDEYQNIYAYAGSDSRYLTMADKVFARYTDRSWRRHKISISYRLNNQTASFINTHFFKHNRINTIRSGCRPVYICASPFETSLYVSLINNLVYERGYDPSDIFILAPSIKLSSPITRLENRLVKMGYNVYCNPKPADNYTSGLCTRGKIKISTIHQTKGLECKICILFGFDDTYYKYYGGPHSPGKFNVLYVALTRATDLTIVIHGHYDIIPGQGPLLLPEDQDPLRLLDMNQLDSTARIYMPYNRIKKVSTGYIKRSGRPRAKNVADLVDELTLDQIDKLKEYIVVTKHIKPTRQYSIIPEVKIPNKSVNKDKYPYIYESVSDLYGSAIPLYYEASTTSDLSMLYNYPDPTIKPVYDGYSEDLPEYTQAFQDIVESRNYTRANLLFIADFDHAVLSNLTNRLVKLGLDYSWADLSLFELGYHHLSEYIQVESGPDQPLYEQLYIKEIGGTALVGRVDIVDQYLWEIKFTTELTDQNLLQLALYCYIYPDSITHDCWKDAKLGRLFNIRTGELIEVQVDISDEVIYDILTPNDVQLVDDITFMLENE